MSSSRTFAKPSRRGLIAVLAIASLIGGALLAVAPPATAQMALGSAPFINSWLVAGPYDTAVADVNYGTDRPADGNWARAATVSASSTWKTTAIGYPDGVDNAASIPALATDGNVGTSWASQMHNSHGDPSTWPAWDPAPELTLSWTRPIKVKEIQVFDRFNAAWPSGTSDVQQVDYTLENAAGTTLASGSITSIDPNGVTPGVAILATAVSNVSAVHLRIVYDGQKTQKNIGLGFSEVNVFDGDGNVSPAAPTNLATGATATASSSWKMTATDYPSGTDLPSTVAAKAIDGDLATNWASQMHNTYGAPSTWPAWDPTPTLTLTWPNSVTVRQIQVFDRNDASWAANTSDVQEVTYTLKDQTGASLATGSITGIDPKGTTPGVVTLPSAVPNVKSLELLIVHDGVKEMKNVGLGFKEVKVFDTALTPRVDSQFEGKTWEYFDDRTWNRNYDDYQDLHGYYAIKKGIDTRNKYVYAASYVFSATAKTVELRYGSSGSHRAYVNDQAIDTASSPAEVHKDMRKVSVNLKAGWNKILLQIKHTYTDDVNGNGVPIAQDPNVAYLGFYARISDASGNEVPGLTYSVTGENKELSIDTRALSATDVVTDGARGRGLPTNVLPIGYREWPYVWNESKYITQNGVSASKFRLLASGGAPDYTWSLATGSSLPAGLTLNADGTFGGMVAADAGVYSFTVKVTDANGATRTKSLSIRVKERPNKWFELGRMSALTHTVTTYGWYVDSNYSADLWAERAKRQGHAMVSVESLQQNYYWPSRFVDMSLYRNQYSPTDANGMVVDGLKQYELAVKRYGMKFGLYYGLDSMGAKSTDVAFQNIQDLILRYDPVYLYYDGPQSMGGKNFDVMFSIVRNYSDDILINSNSENDEYGDPDLRTVEGYEIYSSGRTGSLLTKRAVAEPWKIPVSKQNPSSFFLYGQRDDYRILATESVMNAGRGNVDNKDQSPVFMRGVTWNTPADIAYRYPKAAQEWIDMRENEAAWWAPPGKPERHESTTGTMPYFLKNPHYVDDGKGNITKFEAGLGPDWGYATARDNNIYLHIVKGPDGKQGFNGNSLEIEPVSDTVQSVSWLNEDQTLPFTQTGSKVTIDLTGVERDQVDTIVKLVTNNPKRDFVLTNVVATGEQLTPSTLQVRAEGYRTYTALKATFGSVTYASDNASVATVNSQGVVTAIADGVATITVTGAEGAATASDTIQVKVSGGKVYVKDDLIGASLTVDGHLAFGEFSSQTSHPFKLEGRSAEGGPIGLGSASVTMKSGAVDLSAATPEQPVSIVSTNLVTFAGGAVTTQPVDVPTRVAVWAEVTLDGATVESNKVFMDLMPDRNVAGDATVTASGSTAPFSAAKVVDGLTVTGAKLDGSKWSVAGSGSSWISFELDGSTNVQDVEIFYNTKDQVYVNTPESIEIQTSADGTTWSTVKTITPPAPGSTAYFGYGSRYNVGRITEYLRLNFPAGGNGTSPIDLLEVKVDAVLGTPRVNTASDATATASSQFSANYAPAKATDDIIGENAVGEWASSGEVNPWIQLTWPSARSIDEIVLFDRVLGSADVNAGTLTFSDGTSITVTGIDKAGAAKVVSFPTKSVTWVRFTTTGGTGSNNGLSELQAWLE